jgi:hypothetical protein
VRLHSANLGGTIHTKLKTISTSPLRCRWTSTMLAHARAALVQIASDANAWQSISTNRKAETQHAHRGRGLADHRDELAVDEDLQVIVPTMQSDGLVEKYRVCACRVPAHFFPRESLIIVVRTTHDVLGSGLAKCLTRSRIPQQFSPQRHSDLS